jgi:exonuclease III
VLLNKNKGKIDDIVNDQGKSVLYKLKLGNLNVRSLYNKIDQFSTFVKDNKFDIIGVNETWLDSSIDNAEIEIPGYTIIRKDRNRHGGGVSFYVNDAIHYVVQSDIGNGIESLWLSVKQKDKRNI